ncbi:peptidylprolyl isomerase [Elizabethkingia meningoseptica]|uniref:peptidylprolyl isomerase n=1 Tax=Elizabethkingia meningoseptica TaxID=238 RepID=A0A1V3U1X4_ELIME|nr:MULTISPECIES: peptidylprolyl isomerase [Elizabethkingia]AQX13946.1 peptidylprolyl isomerase [Elizabethkingia meningoseptica]EJK5327869.1 peptidylprolyl isomerase [Elizabethkingia meningoseptica]MBG0515757.1 peptidylprolyl isomerase [Elizabethkingia meningoseptica]MDE5433876.1 peptidylprolyl isomerase [Elizabethkingia meningoseptica]MDE5437004.1 peptidylprolyl isomerase [Elizabethkingia meningoseptica]
MKNKSLISLFALAAHLGFAQSIVINNDAMPVAKFAKEYESGLKNQGIDQTIDSYINFKLIQDFSKSLKADTTQMFRAQVATRLNELKKDSYYPKDLENKFLNDYIAASQKEKQIQVFYAKREEGSKVDFQKIYNDVKLGKTTMDQAILEAKGDAKPLYVKTGILSPELEADIQKLKVGGYSRFVETPETATFIKVVGERPTLGYLIFGTLSYPNDANSEKVKGEIYKALSSGKKFNEVTALYGSNDNEKKNGGVVMGSPAMPDAAYAQMKDLKENEYTKTPILIENKWFIFNIYSKRPYQVTPETKEFFFTDMMNSQYGNAFYDAFIDKLKKSPGYKETAVAAKVKSSYAEFKKVLNDKEALYTYNGQQFTIGDFKTQIKDHLADVEKMDNEKWGQLVEMMNRNFLMRSYTTEFENKPEVKQQLEDIKKNLYSNYFYSEYLKKQIKDHPEWLTDYYNKNKDQFKKEAAAKGRVIIPASEADVDKFVKAIKNPADWEKLKAEYKGKTNDKKEAVANFNEGEMVESAEVFTKYNVPFKTGVHTAKIGGRTLVMANDEILPASVMTQQEATEDGELEELVTSEQIKKILADLKAKTKVTIEPGFVSALQKNFKK